MIMAICPNKKRVLLVNLFIIKGASKLPKNPTKPINIDATLGLIANEAPEF